MMWPKNQAVSRRARRAGLCYLFIFLPGSGGINSSVFASNYSAAFSVSATILPSCRVTAASPTSQEGNGPFQRKSSPSVELHCNFATKAALPRTRLVETVSVPAVTSPDRVVTTPFAKLTAPSPHLQYTFDY